MDKILEAEKRGYEQALLDVEAYFKDHPYFDPDDMMEIYLDGIREAKGI